MLSTIIRVYPANEVYARTPLNSMYERIQHLGWIQRKVVTLDMASTYDVQSIIDQEFPAKGEGSFCLDGEPSYSDAVHATHETQNIVLAGSRRIPKYAGGSFECR